MTERERLIELLEQCSCAYSAPCTSECAECHRVEMYDREIEHIADYLLEHGVIAPPCKVGDKVYMIHHIGDAIQDFVSTDEVTKIGISVKGILYEKSYNFEDFGKTVFTTREEAEAALQEGGEGNG